HRVRRRLVGGGGRGQQLDDETMVIEQLLAQPAEVAKLLAAALAFEREGDDASVANRPWSTAAQALHFAPSFPGTQPSLTASPRNGMPPKRPWRYPCSRSLLSTSSCSG